MKFRTLLKISNWLPKKFLYVCAINVIADATIEYPHIDAADVTAIDVLKLYDVLHNIEVTE